MGDVEEYRYRVRCTGMSANMVSSQEIGGGEGERWESGGWGNQLAQGRG